MGFIEVITAVLVALKLAAVIDWSWWGVFMPMIVTYSAAALFWALAIVFFASRR
jgi:hypothetical protein